MTKKYSSQRCGKYAASTGIQNVQQIQIFLQNCVLCLPHLHLTLPLGGFLSEYRHTVWYGKTGMVWLPEGEKKLTIRLFVFTWSTNVTDRQTDGRTPYADKGRALHRIVRQNVIFCLMWACRNYVRQLKIEKNSIVLYAVNWHVNSGRTIRPACMQAACRLHASVVRTRLNQH